MGTESQSILHDNSAHTKAIYLPNRIIESMKAQTKELINFSNFVQELIDSKYRNPTDLSLAELKHLRKVAMMIKLVEIDTGTANFSNAALLYLYPGRSDVSAVHKKLKEFSYYYAYDGRSPVFG